MTSLSAAERRVRDNATLIAAQTLVFKSLARDGVPTATIGELATTGSGGTPSRSVASYYGGDIPWIKSGDLTDGLIEAVDECITQDGLDNSSAKMFEKGAVVIALYGATVGKTGILTFDAASNQAVCAVTPKSERVSRDFIFWFLRYMREEFLRVSFGGAQPNISQGILRSTVLPVPPRELQDQLCRFFACVAARQSGDLSVSLPELPPPLTDQRRIVAKIERLAAKIEEARGLQHQIAMKKEAMLMSAYHQIAHGAPMRLLSDVAPLVRRRVEFSAEGHYPAIAVRSFGRGTFRKSTLDGSDLTWQKLYEVRAGDILISNIKAWEGAIAVVGEEDNGRVGSHRYLTCVPVTGIAEAEFVCFHLLSPVGLLAVNEASPGSADRNRTLSMKRLQEISIPVPSIDKQAWFKSLVKKVHLARQARARLNTKLDALLPSILDMAFKGGL